MEAMVKVEVKFVAPMTHLAETGSTHAQHVCDVLSPCMSATCSQPYCSLCFLVCCSSRNARVSTIGPLNISRNRWEGVSWLSIGMYMHCVGNSSCSGY